MPCVYRCSFTKNNGERENTCIQIESNIKYCLWSHLTFSMHCTTTIWGRLHPCIFCHKFMYDCLPLKLKYCTGFKAERYEQAYPEARRSLVGFHAQMKTSDSWPLSAVALLLGISKLPSISMLSVWLSKEQWKILLLLFSKKSEPSSRWIMYICNNTLLL